MRGGGRTATGVVGTQPVCGAIGYLRGNRGVGGQRWSCRWDSMLPFASSRMRPLLPIIEPEPNLFPVDKPVTLIALIKTDEPAARASLSPAIYNTELRLNPSALTHKRP